MSDARIDNLIDEGCWKVVLGTCLIKVSKISAHSNISLFLIDSDRV
jgi:hypothetical protein